MCSISKFLWLLKACWKHSRWCESGHTDTRTHDLFCLCSSSRGSWSNGGQRGAGQGVPPAGAGDRKFCRVKDATLKLPGLSGRASQNLKQSQAWRQKGRQSSPLWDSFNLRSLALAVFHFLALHINFPQTLPRLQCRLRGQALFEKSVFWFFLHVSGQMPEITLTHFLSFFHQPVYSFLYSLVTGSGMLYEPYPSRFPNFQSPL